MRVLGRERLKGEGSLNSESTELKIVIRIVAKWWVNVLDQAEIETTLTVLQIPTKPGGGKERVRTKHLADKRGSRAGEHLYLGCVTSPKMVVLAKGELNKAVWKKTSSEAANTKGWAMVR